MSRLLSLAVVMVLSALSVRADLRADLIARADTADAATLYRISGLFERGAHDMEPDSLLAMHYLRQSADSLYADALNLLGYNMILGRMTERDTRRGLSLIEQAADRGSATAYSNLAYLLTEGTLVERDTDKAIYWLRKGVERRQPMAMMQLADMYADGIGMERPDTVAADSLYMRAAAAGLQRADIRLMQIHRDDYADLSPEALLQEGLRYYLGHAPITAVSLLSRAAEGGNARAMALLGEAFATGYGVTYNYGRAMDYFYEAALAGDPAAQFIVAETLEMEPDAFTLPDGETGDDWYARAAEAGITNAKEAADYLHSPIKPTNQTPDIHEDKDHHHSPGMHRCPDCPGR